MELFWNLSTDPKKQAASQANLVIAYFNITGKKMAQLDEPEQEPQAIPVDTDMDEVELERFMQERPCHMKRVI